MTLDVLVVACGILLSAALISILIALWPARRQRPILCFRQHPGAECEPRCLRRCPLPEAELLRRVAGPVGERP